MPFPSVVTAMATLAPMAIVSSAILGLAAPASANPPRFTFQNIGSLGSPGSMYCGNINEQGWITGVCYTGGRNHPFLWDGNELRGYFDFYGPDATELARLYNVCINDSGQMAGVYTPDYFETGEQPWIWSDLDGDRQVGTGELEWPGHGAWDYFSVAGINDNGTIGGTAYRYDEDAGDTFHQAYRLSANGGLYDTVAAFGSDYTWGFGLLGDDGLVGMYWSEGEFVTHAVHLPVDAPPASWNLQDAIGDNKFVAGNTHGQLVGSHNTIDGGFAAVILLDEPAYGLPAGLHPLSPDLYLSWAYDINDDGWIVGESFMPDIGYWVATLWIPNGKGGFDTHNLNDLCCFGGGYPTLEWAGSINNSGQIVCQSYGVDGNSPAVYRVDPLPDLLVFREANQGFWGSWSPGSVPGIDHVGAYLNGTVWEAHPGYTDEDHYPPCESGRWFWDNCTGERLCLSPSLSDSGCGILRYHTLGTFIHNSGDPEENETLNVVVPIPADLADQMEAFIQSQLPPQLPLCPGFLDLPNQGCVPILPFDCAIDYFQPEKQKGRELVDGATLFTCVGLVERAAEEAGHMNGEGFVPNRMETFRVSVTGPNVPAVYTTDVPALTPSKMLSAVDGTAPVHEVESYLFGVMDPVDYMIIDPLGRRLGHTAADGSVNEIPQATLSPDGLVEEFAIYDAIPGTYRIELHGLGHEVAAGVGGSIDLGIGFKGFMEVGEVRTFELVLPDPENCPADLDGNGSVDGGDLGLFLSSWGSVPCVADLDGDGLCNGADLGVMLSNWGLCP